MKSKSASSNARVTSSNLQVMSSNLRVTSLNARVTSSKSRVTSLNPRVMNSNLLVAGSNPRVKVHIYEIQIQIHEFKEIQVNSLKISSFPETLSLKLFGKSWDKSYFQFPLITLCFTFPLFYDYGFSRKHCEEISTLK